MISVHLWLGTNIGIRPKCWWCKGTLASWLMVFMAIPWKDAVIYKGTPLWVVFSLMGNKLFFGERLQRLPPSSTCSCINESDTLQYDNVIIITSSIWLFVDTLNSLLSTDRFMINFPLFLFSMNRFIATIVSCNNNGSFKQIVTNRGCMVDQKDWYCYLDCMQCMLQCFGRVYNFVFAQLYEGSVIST